MANTSYKQSAVVSWLSWHFVEMPEFLVHVWKNYLSFGVYYFSIPLLFKTLLSPWRQYRWYYPRGFDIGGYFSTLISNVFSRLLGAIARFILIVVGIVAQAFIIVAGLLAILIWLALPFIFIFLIYVQF